MKIATGLLFSLILTTHAKDPVLGLIKHIQCIGCNPGFITLTLFDNLEKMEFEIQIKESDYQKIVATLPGKEVFSKEGHCLYWIEKSKSVILKPQSPTQVAIPSLSSDSSGIDPADSSGMESPTLSSSHKVPETPQPHPSRCIDYFPSGNYKATAEIPLDKLP